MWALPLPFLFGYLHAVTVRTFDLARVHARVRVGDEAWLDASARILPVTLAGIARTAPLGLALLAAAFAAAERLALIPCVLAAYVHLRLDLATTVVALEEAPVASAPARAWRLGRGNVRLLGMPTLVQVVPVAAVLGSAWLSTGGTKVALAILLVPTYLVAAALRVAIYERLSKPSCS